MGTLMYTRLLKHAGCIILGGYDRMLCLYVAQRGYCKIIMSAWCGSPDLEAVLATTNCRS